MLDLLILSILIGFVLGVTSGLIPGIHTNNFALILLDGMGMAAIR